MSLTSKSLIAGLLFGTLLCAAQTAQTDGAAVKDFQQRVQQYSSLKNQHGVSRKPTSSPDKLAQQKEEAAEKAKNARPSAKQGDIFTPEISAYFKKQIQATLHGPGGEKVRASLKRAEPLPNLNLKVNESYPAKLPLQSTPPTLLLNLPQLPKHLQYRVVGSNLVLYDEATRLIVDLIPNAID